jgi:hypothetical protein
VHGERLMTLTQTPLSARRSKINSTKLKKRKMQSNINMKRERKIRHILYTNLFHLSRLPWCHLKNYLSIRAYYMAHLAIHHKMFSFEGYQMSTVDGLLY